MSARIALSIALLLAGCATPAPAPQVAADAADPLAWGKACGASEDWNQPGPPFRIAGEAYYVGTCGITAILLADPAGHVLIDSGTDKGAEVVLANIRALGFDPRDVKTILMSHEHFDHVGGMARLQAATGATIMAHPEAAKVLRSGMPSPEDPQAGSDHPPFPAVTGPIVEIATEAEIPLGKRAMRPLFTPGHTLGATSWTWREDVGGGGMTMAYADSLNPISDDAYRFSDHPGLVAAFRAGIAKVGVIDRCLLVTPHPSSSGMKTRLEPYGLVLDSRTACADYAARITERVDARLAKEAAGG